MITTSLLWLAIFFGANPVTLAKGEPADYMVRQGWYNGSIVRFVPFAASDSLVAKELSYFNTFGDDGQPVDWVPALQNIINVDAFNEVYFINSMQTAVFGANRDCPCYTPLWRVNVLEWKLGAVKTPLISEADVLAAFFAGKLVVVRPFSILDATIVQDENGNVIPQALNLRFQTGEVAPTIELPTFLVYAPESSIWRRPTVRRIVITDVSDQALATQLGANYAPRLANIAAPTCNPVYAFIDLVPPSQYPLIDQVQQYRPFDFLQINMNYNPIKCWSLFDRGTLPKSAIVNNIPYANLLQARGVISQVPAGPIVTNSPVVVPVPE